HPDNSQRPFRTSPILIGLLASAAVWIVTPYNNFVILGAFVSDSYLPIAGFTALLIIVLLANPMLRRYMPAIAYSEKDFALILSMILIASVLPGQGLLRTVPYSLVGLAVHVRENARFAEFFATMRLPSVLFPETMAFGVATPVADAFVNELSPGDSIPWGAWVVPVLVWGVFFICCFLLMIGLALILFPQWRNNERLSFPLLAVHQSLIEDPKEGSFFSALFKERSFWLAAVLVFIIHQFAGWQLQNPEGVPAFPVSWTLRRLFLDGPLRYLPAHIHTNRLYFVFLGIAYFMPSRIGFSIWFFAVAYGFYVVAGNTLFPPYYSMTINDHRFGAMLALSLWVVWLGRAHWAEIIQCMIRKPLDAEGRRNRQAGMMFLTGCVGMFLWLVWVGVQPAWALVFIVLGFMISLTITRLVAETGMPFIRIDMAHQMSFLRLFPNSWLTGTSLLFSYFIVMVFAIGSRVSCTTMAAHAIGLHERESPSVQSRLCWLLVGVLAIGLIIGWGASLTANYHYSASINGEERPVCVYAYGIVGKIVTALQDFSQGRFTPPPYRQILHIGFGFAAVALLQWASLVMPTWPIHPIGFVMINTYYMNEAWASVFLGWLIKILILKYAGARAYRAARPFFLGLIVGELIAGAFWNVILGVLVLLGMSYTRVKIQPY
ncbi:MAG TPA: hypothetical protein PKH07_09095, partial [bacterium]|nr:hypothetical protein [bacterium]